jgi:hypothetical protein
MMLAASRCQGRVSNILWRPLSATLHVVQLLCVQLLSPARSMMPHKVAAVLRTVLTC